jgi:hypothetical protein
MWPQTESNPFSHHCDTGPHPQFDRKVNFTVAAGDALRSRKWSNQVLQFEKLLVVRKLVVLEQPSCFLPPLFSALSSIIHPWFYLCVCVCVSLSLSLFGMEDSIGNSNNHYCLKVDTFFLGGLRS